MLSLILVGCGGPNDETLVDELRVMAIVADPPEAAPGSELSLEVVVADPAGEGYELRVWPCTDLGEGCLEADPVMEEAGVVTVQPALAELGGPVPFAVYAMACAPGVDCSVPDPADPFGFMQDKPLEGVSLAYRTILATPFPAAQNPSLTPIFDSVDPAGDTLEFEVLGGVDVRLWGYATSGGFGATDTPVENGRGSINFYPEEGVEPQGDLWVVAQSADGGVAVWQGSVGG